MDDLMQKIINISQESKYSKNKPNVNKSLLDSRPDYRNKPIYTLKDSSDKKYSH